MKKIFLLMLITILTLISANSYAQTDANEYAYRWEINLNLNYYAHSNKVFDLPDYNVMPSIGVSYFINDYMYASSNVNMYRNNKIGYKISYGFDYPSEVFIPYVELSFNRNHSSWGYFIHDQTFDYKIGISYLIPPSFLSNTSLYIDSTNTFSTKDNFNFGVVSKISERLDIDISSNYSPKYKDVSFTTSLGILL